MQRPIAEKLMKIMLSIDEPLSVATELTDEIEDPEEARLIRRGIAEVVSKVFSGVMIPIIRQYRDLDPTREKPEKFGQS